MLCHVGLSLGALLRSVTLWIQHLDTIAKGVLTTVTYRPVSGDPNPIVARTGRQSISKDAPKLFAAESSDGALLVFKEVADSPFESLGAAAQEVSTFNVRQSSCHSSPSPEMES